MDEFMSAAMTLTITIKAEAVQEAVTAADMWKQANISEQGLVLDEIKRGLVHTDRIYVIYRKEWTSEKAQ